MPCEVVEAAHVEDANGVPCGRTSNACCSICESALCVQHAEMCAMCSRTFCPSCIRGHQSSGVDKKQATGFYGSSSGGKESVMICGSEQSGIRARDRLIRLPGISA